MKITQHELEQIMHEQLLKQIHIMYDIHLENYAVLPEVHEEVRHKREYAVIESNDWNLFLDSLERVFFVMLSRLVDTFFSRTSWTMLLYAENHSISVA